MSGEERLLTCRQPDIKRYSVTQLYLLKTIFVFQYATCFGQTWSTSGCMQQYVREEATKRNMFVHYTL